MMSKLSEDSDEIEVPRRVTEININFLSPEALTHSLAGGKTPGRFSNTNEIKNSTRYEESGGLVIPDFLSPIQQVDTPLPEKLSELTSMWNSPPGTLSSGTRELQTCPPSHVIAKGIPSRYASTPRSPKSCIPDSDNWETLPSALTSYESSELAPRSHNFTYSMFSQIADTPDIVDLSSRPLDLSQSNKRSYGLALDLTQCNKKDQRLLSKVWEQSDEVTDKECHEKPLDLSVKRKNLSYFHRSACTSPVVALADGEASDRRNRLQSSRQDNTIYKQSEATDGQSKNQPLDLRGSSYIEVQSNSPLEVAAGGEYRDGKDIDEDDRLGSYTKYDIVETPIPLRSTCWRRVHLRYRSQTGGWTSSTSSSPEMKVLSVTRTYGKSQMDDVSMQHALTSISQNRIEGDTFNDHPTIQAAIKTRSKRKDTTIQHTFTCISPIRVEDAFSTFKTSPSRKAAVKTRSKRKGRKRVKENMVHVQKQVDVLEASYARTFPEEHAKHRHVPTDTIACSFSIHSYLVYSQK